MYNRRLNEERHRKRGQISRPVFIYGPGGVFKGNAPRRIEPLPKIFCLEENRDEVVAFLDSLKFRIGLNSKIQSFLLRSGRIRKIGNNVDSKATGELHGVRLLAPMIRPPPQPLQLNSVKWPLLPTLSSSQSNPKAWRWLFVARASARRDPAGWGALSR